MAGPLVVEGEGFIVSPGGIVMSLKTYCAPLLPASAGLPVSGFVGVVVLDEAVDPVQVFRQPVTVMVRSSDDIGFCGSVGLVWGVCAMAWAPAKTRPRPKTVNVRVMTVLLGFMQCSPHRWRQAVHELRQPVHCSAADTCYERAL